ncbi:RagB/SusD family nutrient uptake outer membrane protein [Zobellia laminariae]|uniref:RagB/SusD family nutrient uptake outer membrane protein n=1 Tax=Zobellia laminariae TaxID=248906 RepID=UPI0026F415FC|nr:RagB/SusD family nutrient uptake outer membrane protein [Zobellia laminariae]WKX76404.1 RagB/SusD family nutrient uptake outer membrane protein [Zobellia laminariae]
MKKYIISIVVIALLFGCEDFLEEEVYTEYDPSVFLQDEAGVDALLTGAYSAAIYSNFQAIDHFNVQQLNTDETWETGGGLNRRVLPLIEFTWDASTDYFNNGYNRFYNAIAAANNVLSVIDGLDNLEEATLKKIEAEARFLRAFFYYNLHSYFGPTPIVTVPDGATLDEIEAVGKETPRATEEEYRSYVEGDLLYASENLSYGGLSSRANKGNALGLLAKFHLNNKEWEKASETAQEVISNGGYVLYDDYTKLFAVDGEDNNEYLFRFEAAVGTNQANVYIPHAFPPNYPIQSNWENFGAQFRTYTLFYETFEEVDIRRQLMISEYTPTTTGVITLLSRDADGNVLDDVRSLKFVPDPNAAGRFSGNDSPIIRLADIILARAEALNEVSGPTQESIDLINEIRNRASVDEVVLTDFSSKEELRNFILAERGRELYSEGLRREDLIRHNKFIERALERGKSAQPHQVVYPLPQPQIDNNPNLEQNPYY